VSDGRTHHVWSSLIELGDNDDPTRLIEHFNHYCHENYHAAPVFVFDNLEQAMNEAFDAAPMGEVPLALSLE
jgi:hypothetical protein